MRSWPPGAKSVADQIAATAPTRKVRIGKRPRKGPSIKWHKAQ